MYKIFISRTENYYGQTIATNFKTVDFKTACEHKNIKPKIGQYRRIFKSIQRDRMNDQYPSPYKVAEFFNLEAMPSPEDDYQPSAWAATHAYIKAMYGAEYAQSFTPAGYQPLALAA